MGGGPGGKTASSIAVSEIVNGVNEAADDEKDLQKIVAEAVKRANKAIVEAGQANPELKGMGSTATVLLLNEQSAIVAHVGDSRVYQFRGKEKIFRTFDHSVVFDMVRQKIITEEQARLSANSNVITRALGIGPELEVEVTEVPYEQGDRFLLCTDGIHGSMPEPELIKLATNLKNALGPITDNIATTVDELGRKDGGEHDNLTLALIETKNDSKLKEPMSRKTKLILQALGALCALSLILNVVLFSCSGKKEDNSGLKTQILQLRDSVQQKDSTIKKQEVIIKGLQKDTFKLNTTIEQYRKTMGDAAKSMDETAKKLKQEN